MFIEGGGIAAAYLTMPAWLMMNIPIMVLSILMPTKFLDATLFSSAGNLILLVLSAAMNVYAAYWAVSHLRR